MGKILELLEREDGCLSIGRLCAILTFLLWVAVTIYLLLASKVWGHYDTLTIAAIGNLLVQVANKAVETKLFKVGGAKNE